MSVHELLTKKAAAQKVGEHGLLALDWHSGNRSVLVDELSGVIVGQTLATKPEDIYRALIEATAFGARTIVEAFKRRRRAGIGVRGRGGLAGHVSHPAAVTRIAAWQRAAAGAAAVRQLKLARFGDNMRDVAVTERDRYGARLEAGLRAFLTNGGFGAFTTNFQDLGGLRQLPGLAVQRLMADGFGFGGEGHWKTSVMLHTIKAMERGIPPFRTSALRPIVVEPAAPVDALASKVCAAAVSASIVSTPAHIKDPPW